MQNELEWADLWAAMDQSPEWIRTSESMYYKMLEALPPAAMGNGAFLVGEAADHNDNGEAVYACFVSHPSGEYEAKYMTLAEFKAKAAMRA